MRFRTALLAALAMFVATAATAADWRAGTDGASGAVVAGLRPGSFMVAYYAITTTETTPVLSLTCSGTTWEVFNPTSVTLDVQSSDDASKTNTHDIVTGIDGSTVTAKSIDDAFGFLLGNITAGTGGVIKVTCRP